MVLPTPHVLPHVSSWITEISKAVISPLLHATIFWIDMLAKSQVPQITNPPSLRPTGYTGNC